MPPKPRVMPTRLNIISLYRSLLRNSKKLPYPYLQEFFKVKARVDVKALLDTEENTPLLSRKFKRVSKVLGRMQLVNAGETNRQGRRAFDHLLHAASGRKGPLKWDIMKPLLTDPTAELPPRIIPAVEKSRPPVYSPELTALLTSTASRRTKALYPKNLKTPPNLPARADPMSSEARLLGPFSKRREVNIRWRYFTEEWKKVYPPLQVEVVERNADSDQAKPSSDKKALANAGIRPVGLQGMGVYEEFVKAAGPVGTPRRPTRRERKALKIAIPPDQPDSRIRFQSPLPNRWLRRRHRQLLGTLPRLVYTHSESKDGEDSKGRYTVRLEPSALISDGRVETGRMPLAEAADLEWIQHSKQK